MHLHSLPRVLLTNSVHAAEGTKDILEEGVLRELLAAVDLEYLLDRVGMHAAVNWHDTLSLGAHMSTCLPALHTLVRFPIDMYCSTAGLRRLALVVSWALHSVHPAWANGLVA